VGAAATAARFFGGCPRRFVGPCNDAERREERAGPCPRLSTQQPRSAISARHLGYAGGWNSTLGTYFKKLNEGWDAEPGVPEPHVRTDETGLTLTFFLNPQLNPQFRDYDHGELFFPNCWRYRLGYPNDEGWYKGHCRFRCLAPDWGDFYEVSGDLLDSGPPDWVLLRSDHSGLSRHFLFYFKDETFECVADSWHFKVLPVTDAEVLAILRRSGPW
jgi:hypothetical protein